MNLGFSLVPFPRGDSDLCDIWRCAARNAPFFLSWPWMGTLLDRLEPGGEPFLLSEGGVPLALITHRRAKLGGIWPVSRWFVNESGNNLHDRLAMEYNGLLLQDRMGEAFAWLFQNIPDPGQITMRNSCKIAGQAFLRAADDCGWSGELESKSSVPILDYRQLNTANGNYLASRGRNTRASLKRAMRLYREEFGELTLARAETLADAAATFKALQVLHEEQWREKGRPGAGANPLFRPFHLKLIERAFSSGNVDLVTVTAGEQTIGYLYNFVKDAQVLAYQSGFMKPADNRYKPGYVCHLMAIEDYLRQGMRAYNFLAGAAPYKMQLANCSDELLSVSAVPRGHAVHLYRQARGRLSWFRSNAPS